MEGGREVKRGSLLFVGIIFVFVLLTREEGYEDENEEKRICIPFTVD